MRQRHLATTFTTQIFWTAKILVFLVIMAFQAQAMNDDIAHR